MPCELWSVLQQRVTDAIEELERVEHHLPARGQTPSHLEGLQQSQERLFQALSELQQHEREHGCHAREEAEPKQT